jgi:acyl dehydratase
MHQPIPRRVRLKELPTLVGATLGSSGSILVTQEHIDQFADVTLDRQWLHVDPERAATGPFGSTIAHGHLTLALALALLWQVIEVTDAVQVVNYGLNKVRFPAPLKVGSSVRLDVELLAADPVDNGYQLTFRGSFRTPGQEKPVCVAEGIFHYYAVDDPVEV